MESTGSDFSQIIPELSGDIEFICRDDGQHLLFNQKKGYRLKISEEVYFLLKNINGEKNILEITDAVQFRYQGSISPDEVYEVLYGKLAEYGCVLSDKEVRDANPTYLKLRITLIGNSVSSHITKYCKWLCNPTLFYPLFVGIFIYLILFSIFRWHSIVGELQQMDIVNTILVFALSSLGVFCHEFGHVSACDYFGAKHGDIGFGFYIFTPVMYADVSDIWRLSSRERIICNLSGMYFGNLFCVFVSIVYLISGNSLFLYMSLFEFIQSLYNLNPLVKYDGYWVLSDMLDVPNLHAASYKKAKELFRNYRNYSIRDWLLSLYGLTSMTYILAFIVVLLVLSPGSIFYFPYNLYRYVADLLSGSTSFALSGLTQFILPFIFYWLILRWIIQYVKKYGRYVNIGNGTKSSTSFQPR